LVFALLAVLDLSSIGAMAPHARDVALADPPSSLFDIPDLDRIDEPSGEWRPFVEFNGASYRVADLDGRSGSLGLDRFGLSWDLERQHRNGNVLAFGVDYQRLSYSDGYGLAGVAAPVESADFWRLEASYHHRSSEDWSWKLGGRAEAGVVDDVLPWEELAFGGTMGLTLHATESLDLELSLDAFDRPESDVRLIPLALVDWRLSDDLRLGRVAGGFGLDYHYDPRTNYFLAFDYEERSYRLASADLPAGGLLRDQERSVRAGLIWQPKQAVQLELFVGAADRHMVLFDDGEGLDSFDVEAAPFAGFRLLFGKGSIF
jgi:hypothetical protein